MRPLRWILSCRVLGHRCLIFHAGLPRRRGNGRGISRPAEVEPRRADFGGERRCRQRFSLEGEEQPTPPFERGVARSDDDDCDVFVAVLS